jgi:hypothetical protein
MADEWMNAISSGVVCSWYYFFFVVAAIIAALALVGFAASIAGVMKAPRGVTMAVSFAYLLQAAIAAVGSLFAYLICDRALLSGKGSATTAIAN